MTVPINQVVHSDCLDVLCDLPDSAVDLVYLDPPFNTGRIMSAAQGRFEDRWEDMDAYLAFMRPRLTQLHRILRPTASLLLHCDWRTCHHLRLLLDEIFGEENFINHLIWSYGLGGSSPRRFARKHDDILFYGRTGEYFFAPPMVPATSLRMRGQLKKSSDVLEIPSINNMARERVGYPTQKPLALLRLLIQACCPPGADRIVLDPFCGSGTTLVAARDLGRSFIGIDRNPEAVRTAVARLASDHSGWKAPAGAETLPQEMVAPDS
jgi:DNA modification methylase